MIAPSIQRIITVSNEVDKMCAQPHFVLLGQDVTADMVVEFWVIVNAKLKNLMNKGLSQDVALAHVRSANLPVAYPLEEEVFQDEKLKGAVRIAQAMRAHAPRKVAD